MILPITQYFLMPQWQKIILILFVYLILLKIGGLHKDLMFVECSNEDQKMDLLDEADSKATTTRNRLSLAPSKVYEGAEAKAAVERYIEQGKGVRDLANNYDSNPKRACEKIVNEFYENSTTHVAEKKIKANMLNAQIWENYQAKLANERSELTNQITSLERINDTLSSEITHHRTRTPVSLSVSEGSTFVGGNAQGSSISPYNLDTVSEGHTVNRSLEGDFAVESRQPLIRHEVNIDYKAEEKQQSPIIDNSTCCNCSHCAIDFTGNKDFCKFTIPKPKCNIS